MIEFNVNENVFVKLTEIGLLELKRQHEEFRKEFPKIGGTFAPPKVDEDGWSEWQLHTLMKTFGHMMTAGYQVPFKTTIKFDA